MKTKLYTAIAILSMAFGMTACSSSDDLENGGGNNENNGKTQYLTVTIQNTQTTPTGAKAATRANTVTDGGYTNGTADEGGISSVRFYFFNSDGTPYSLTNSTPSGVNWLDRDVTMNEVTDQPTVERRSTVILLINGTTGTVPSRIYAIANPSSITTPSSAAALSTTQSMTAAQLQAANLQSSTYATTTTSTSGTTINNFVMTNSAYYDNGSFACTTDISNNVKNTEAEARNNPAQIYVERLAAKVTVSHSSDSNWSNEDVDNDGTNELLYKLGSYTLNTTSTTTTTQDVYAVIRGWGLADEQPNGKLTKDLGTGFTDDQLGISPWTTPNYFRSFWEITPTLNVGNDIKLTHTFNSYKGNGAALDGNTIAYTMPNTPTAATTDDDANRNTNVTDRTKVVLAAQLMYKDASNTWQPAEICTYRGVNYIGLGNLKTAILADLKGHISKNTGTITEPTWEDLTDENIEFYPATDATYGTGGKVYQVYVGLNFGSGVASYGVVQSDGTVTQFTSYTSGLISALGQYAPYADVRNSGYTYYYTTIRHLATDATKLGYFGVVRNHWYKLTINSLGGFGTPVYDPDKPIDPVTPSDSRSYLAAQINVLQWRVVNQTVDINGTPITTSAKKH